MRLMKVVSPIRVKLWQLCAALLAIANLAYLLNNVFGWILTLTFFLYVPGYLLLRRLTNPSNLGFAKISLSVGISLALMTICGLLLNSLHFMGFSRPLQTLNIFIALDIMVIALMVINRTISVRIPTRLPHFSREEYLFGILFTLLPVLAIFGAIRLNNGASNILTMVMIVMICTLYLSLIVRPKQAKIYPYAIFMTALALLFAISLRGWSITGHDIHHEFAVFSSVKRLGYWSPSTDPGDPYYACLSITILPTIMAKITGITAIFIYKIVFQVALAAIVPAVYAFAKKFVSEKLALLGVFALMTFPTFINDLPFLNRQEIAFGYFILIIYINFSRMANRAKTLLTVLMLLSIILSHYSSSYVTISILLLALVIYKILSRLFHNKTRLNIPLLSLPIIIMAFLATFAWNAQITSSSSNLSNTLAKALNGILGKSEPTVSSYSLAPTAKKVSPAQQFAQKVIQLQIPAAYSSPSLVPLTVIGKNISKHVNITNLHTQRHGAIARLLQVFVVVGTLMLLLSYRKRSVTAQEIYITAASISFLTALMLFTFVPQLSIGYDVTRLFQQSLTVLWLPVIFFCTGIFKWLGKRRDVATAALLTIIYLNLSGFVPQLTGGFLPNLALNNSGFYYNFFYTHKSDEIGTKWLADERLRYMTVFMDSNAAAPPLKFPVALGVINGRSQGYYYTDYTNNTTGHYRTILSSGFVEYTSSAFTGGKSQIYSNGNSKIYFTWPMSTRN